MARFASGLAYLDDAPLFTLPGAYQSEPFDLGGRKGFIRLLCEDPGEEAREEMPAAGCSLLRSSPQYAPEIRRPAAFVPADTPFDYV